MKDNELTGFSQPIYSDFIASRDLIYNPCEFKISKLLPEKESIEYGACSFKLDAATMIYRVAKITPTKVGQFVTFWKRQENGPIQPYDIDDDIDFFIVSVRKNNHFGQFIFPKSALFKYGVLSHQGKGGKRAFRVYPPWDRALNKQATKTQAWQLEYFLNASKDERIDFRKVRNFFSLQQVQEKY